MFKALAEGPPRFRRIAVVADTDAPTPPCGACRQILWEFGGDLEVILANLRRETGRHRLADLLPLPFDARLLEAGSMRSARVHRSDSVHAAMGPGPDTQYPWTARESRGPDWTSVPMDLISPVQLNAYASDD